LRRPPIVAFCGGTGPGVERGPRRNGCGERMARSGETGKRATGGAAAWLRDATIGLAAQMRWSFLPPLMVYFAAGVSGLTSVVGAFFVKEELALSAAFLAGIAFWAGLPWTLKMPLGHLVDVIWRWKALLVLLGAALIAAGLLVMHGLVTRIDAMEAIAPAGAWYVAAALLGPIGYVIQDTVADAMTVEAVPSVDADGRPFSEDRLKAMHTTMQTLGRFAIISGLAAVAAVNIVAFEGVETMGPAEKTAIYARIYLMALAIPAISVSGVALGWAMTRRRMARLRAAGMGAEEAARRVNPEAASVEPDWRIFLGGLGFAVFSVGVGLADPPFSQEIVFAGSMAIVVVLMRWLMKRLEPAQARALVGTAIVIFVFRAVPLPGPGATWFTIDELGFDQRFLSVLGLIASALTLVGMVALRPLMATRSIAWIVVALTLASGVLALPNIGLYYGVQRWTEAWTGGVVDARFIAVIDTAMESPLGQIAMIPMLAWIARNAPDDLKATFFAVMASFTNLALSASALGARWLNEVFVVTREVTDRETGAVATQADYSQLGALLIVVAAIGVCAPLLAVALVQRSPLRTES
jgi:hypothetical protein